MAVQLTIEFDKLIELVDQLPIDQQRNLMHHLAQKAENRILTSQEKVELLNATVHDLGLIPAGFSFSREDWYSDDGR